MMDRFKMKSFNLIHPEQSPSNKDYMVMFEGGYEPRVLPLEGTKFQWGCFSEIRQENSFLSYQHHHRHQRFCWLWLSLPRGI